MNKNKILQKYWPIILLLCTIPITLFSKQNLFEDLKNKFYTKNPNEQKIFKSSNQLPKMIFKIKNEIEDHQKNLVFSTEKMIGQKYILHFFASWCGYRVYDHQNFMKIKNKAMPIYGIAWKDSTENLNEMLKSMGNPYKEILLDPFGSSSAALNIQGIPLTIIIDSKNDVVFARAGEIKENELIEHFEKAN